MDSLVSPQPPMQPQPQAALAPLATTAADADAGAYHPLLWFCFWLVAWGLLGHFIMGVYARALDGAWWLSRRIRQRGGGGSKRKGGEGVLHVGAADQHAWGQRLLLAYSTLSASKQAYMRRLLRSFIYYTGAIVAGFWFLLTHFREPVDLYLVYTPAMEVAFCAAAAHFLYCCLEDWPCRSHMGRTRREQLVVFWGYIVHHLLTSLAYLMVVRHGQLASMCVMGLTFEGPVLFGCLREVVALYDQEWDLFDRVPPVLLKINWALAFASLLPCRYVSIGFFLYSALHWRAHLSLVAWEMQVAYWSFGLLFLFINMYFTWLLTFWYRQDVRYLKKKRARQREQKQMQTEQTQQQQHQQQQYQQQSESDPYGQAVQRSLPSNQPYSHDPLASTSDGSGATAVAAPLSRPLSPLLHPHGQGHSAGGYAGQEVAAAAMATTTNATHPAATQRHTAPTAQAYGPGALQSYAPR